MKQQQKLTKQEILQKNKLQKKTNIQVAKKTFFKQYISSEENRNYTSGDKLVGLNNRFNFLCKILYFKNGDWGLGIGDWGLGIGDWAQSPIPNPQSPFKIFLILNKYLI